MVTAIAVIGLLTLYSAAGGSINPWALKQAVIFFVFFTVAIAMSWIKESTIKSVAFPLYTVVLIMLFFVELLGFVGKGAQRWLDIGPIRLQPSEFMKPAIVLVLARFYELLPPADIRKWRAIWPAALLLGIPAALILVQPDLGTAVMVILIGGTVMFVAGLPWWLFAGAFGAVAIAAPIAFSLMRGYQRDRVLIFLNPESDPLGAGYHITQSQIAIGSGGLFGKGYLQGSQSHLDYLPEGHTDFVFSTMVEEWGFAGGLVLIVAFAIVIRWGMRVSIRSKTRFAQLTAAGLSATIFFYVAINLMMVMGLAPVVGVPLPLVSYGGSAVMTVMICIGLLMALERQQRTSTGLSTIRIPA
jgi:rod shape determining protein RodA